MRELVVLVAGAAWSDNRKSLIRKAAERAHISYRQAKSLFYGEITDTNHRSARLMRDAAERLSGRHEAKVYAAFENTRQLAIAHLLALRQALITTDADFHCESVAAIERDLARMGCRLESETGRGNAPGRDEEI